VLVAGISHLLFVKCDKREEREGSLTAADSMVVKCLAKPMF